MKVIIAYLNGDLKPGISIILDYVDLDEHLKDADYVFVGDEQTSMEKVPTGITQRVQQINKVAVIALYGEIKNDPKNLHDLEVTAYFSIMPKPMNLEEAMKKNNALSFLERQSREICRLLQLQYLAVNSKNN